MSYRAFSALCGAIIIVLAPIAAVQAQQGKLEIADGGAHDWGTVQPGRLKTLVKLTNVGSGPLSIMEVRPTCLCTIAPIDKKFLKPGDVARVDITLDVSGKTGLVERSIRILSVDSTTGTHAVDTAWIRLKAMVKPDITISPAPSLIVGTAKIGQPAHVLPLKIKNTSDGAITFDPPELLQGATVGATFEMKAKKTLQPGEEFELKATVTPSAVGTMIGVAVMRTTDARMAVIRLEVRGTVTGGSISSDPAPPKTPH